MDHLPPRSEEGTIKLMEGQRKGRTKPANLREQVDNKTMDMYKQTSSKLFHTPTATANQMAPSMIKRDPGSWGRDMMWPTPTTKGYGHASMGQTMIFRKKVEAGEMTEQQAEQMLGCTLRPPRMEKWNYPKREMFPTPTARDYKDSGNMENWKENRQRMSLPRKVYWENRKKEMFPTPSANEDAAGRPGGKMQKMLGNHPSVRDQSPGTLNPTWVEWLMGYPTGYTDLDV